MILAKSEILRRLESGELVVTKDRINANASKRDGETPMPFDETNVGDNSIDVHLSPHLAVYNNVCKIDRDVDGRILNISPDPDGTIESDQDNEITRFLIPPKGIRLVPGVLYLGSTLEYTESHNVVPTLDGKSSGGRLGANIHATAGKGDVGFAGWWTLEIYVVQPVRIFAGMPIGQLSYETIAGVTPGYSSKLDSKYADPSPYPQASRMFKNFDPETRLWK